MFKKAIAVFFIVIVSLGTGCSKLTWQTFSSQDGSLTVEVPGDPKYSRKSTNTPLGSIGLDIYQIEKSNTLYMFSISKMPVELSKVKSTQQLLSDAREGGLRGVQGTLVKEDKIKINGYPGIEITANAKQSHKVFARIIIAGNKLYIVMAVTKQSSDSPSTDIRKYLDSIKIHS